LQCGSMDTMSSISTSMTRLKPAEWNTNTFEASSMSTESRHVHVAACAEWDAVFVSLTATRENVDACAEQTDAVRRHGILLSLISKVSTCSHISNGLTCQMTR
jgi:hypothetical protein